MLLTLYSSRLLQLSIVERFMCYDCFRTPGIGFLSYREEDEDDFKTFMYFTHLFIDVIKILYLKKMVAGYYLPFLKKDGLKIKAFSL